MVLLNFGEPTAPFLPPAPYNMHYRNHPYDGEIAALDEQVGRFVHYLKRSGLFESSIIVFASPYGETLDDEIHTGSLNDSILGSALSITAPGLLPRMRLYESAVSLVDVYPTVLQLLALRSGVRSDGEVLFQTGSDREIKPKEIHATTFVPTLFGFPEETAIRTKEGIWVRKNAGTENPGKVLDRALLLAREGKKEDARLLLSDCCNGREISPALERLQMELQ